MKQENQNNINELNNQLKQIPHIPGLYQILSKPVYFGIAVQMLLGYDLAQPGQPLYAETLCDDLKYIQKNDRDFIIKQLNNSTYGTEPLDRLYSLHAYLEPHGITLYDSSYRSHLGAHLAWLMGQMSAQYDKHAYNVHVKNDLAQMEYLVQELRNSIPPVSYQNYTDMNPQSALANQIKKKIQPSIDRCGRHYAEHLAYAGQLWINRIKQDIK